MDVKKEIYDLCQAIMNLPSEQVRSFMVNKSKQFGDQPRGVSLYFRMVLENLSAISAIIGENRIDARLDDNDPSVGFYIPSDGSMAEFEDDGEENIKQNPNYYDDTVFLNENGYVSFHSYDERL